MLRVPDCVIGCIGFGVPQPTEWQHIGDQIKAASIFARANFVNVQQITYRSARSTSSQGQAHIVSTAIRLPRSYESGPEVGTWFSIDPQPASISATINISIVFICAFPSDCGRIIRLAAIKNDSSRVYLCVGGLRKRAWKWETP
jgi:hypothetical protein